MRNYSLHYHYCYCTVAMITFGSSTFNGLESSGVIMATVIISGGIVSSRDISVPITFTAGTATGSYCLLHKIYKSCTIIIIIFALI